MSRQAITVELPEEVYEQVKRAAQGMKRPLERVSAKHCESCDAVAREGAFGVPLRA